jgi:cell division protein FtsI/penicillin-binding protein 2
MNSHDVPPTLIFNRFLFRTVPGRLLHALINLCVILQFCSPQVQPTWAADSVVNALSLLLSESTPSANVSAMSLLKNQPLGNSATLDGRSLVQGAGPLASFTWFGPFTPVVDAARALYESLGFARAFADSCNTAMIGAAGGLPESALADAAASFGFGADYSLGPTTLGGSFPAPATEVERAAAAIGQAQVTASPLHMATVAAAVLDGTWRTPVLLPDEAGDRPTRPLDPAARSQLAELMRLVVTEGSGTAANVPGLDVIGKTGTAEFGSGDPLPTHAWFIGGWNGLGFAVVLEGGGVGGRDAAPIAAQFLQGLPGG